ncbi:glycosyltransferase family 4 protein [Neorhodopirellula pilleata]|uniref:D-inositol-3-phosphate glycosyltransferase n=1 Tax=Neorhodopirellula pilleata TaxID=2714738 RepID=A0A5C6AQ42_9BACT|nr:glycosyltransferase family 1 protein [Neorhodopirellula pilleata]TWU01349.1 D-inositol-3-phosphate glycosyltransferase [Neorhodopirellula pilleata]
MKVWIDGIAFENAQQKGIWRVFFEIMSRTSQVIDYTLWLRSAAKQPIPRGVRVYQDNGREEIGRYSLSKRIVRRLANRSVPKELKNADLFHSTGFTLPLHDGIKTVNTVYDMIAESHFYIGIRELEEGISVKQQAYERACLLSCISQATASELTAYQPHLTSKARVIPLGHEHLLSEKSTVRESMAGSMNAALFIGNRYGYKNFVNLLYAMLTSAWPPKVGLHVIGPPFSSAELAWIKRSGLSDRVSHLGCLSTAGLSSAYRTARCLVFPSFQEGFGLPCLEAHSFRCPLVCSDIPVFHEVAGGAALFFDPHLPTDIAQQVNRIGDPNVRQPIIDEGTENLLRFCWDTSAQRTAEFYEEALRQ